MEGSPRFRGVFGIPPSPFDADGELDASALEMVVAFMLDAGVHGVVGPVNVSESTSLTDRERQRFVEVLTGSVGGQVPVVAATHAPSAHQARQYARHARRVGVDAVIAMPPYAAQPTLNETVEYYRMIAAETELPVFIQNHTRPSGGRSLSASELVAVLHEVEGVQYVKEETEAAHHLIPELLAAAGTDIEGVMGGKGGQHLPDEHHRGACGTMPSAAFVDIIVRLWEALETSDVEESTRIYEALLPLAVLEAQWGAPLITKEMLRRRGVLASASTRQPGIRSLDPASERQIEQLVPRAREWMQPSLPIVSADGAQVPGA